MEMTYGWAKHSPAEKVPFPSEHREADQTLSFHLPDYSEDGGQSSEWPRPDSFVS